MKKITLLTVFTFISVVGLNAQGVGFGLKGGVNFANQNYEYQGISASPDARTGFHVGAFASIMFAGKIGLQPEALYSMKGSEFSFSAFGSTSSTETRLSYIEIPVLVRFQPISILSIHAGPQFGILMSAESEVSDGTNTVEDDIKDNLKGSDLSVALGGQVDLPMGLIGGMRYVHGLSDINDEDGSNTEVKNRTFQIYVGWKFVGN